MRYPASEKLEIIRLVEQSHLPTRQTLDRLGIPRRTFYRWYDRYLNGGPEALKDRSSAPSRVWNRIPANIRDQIIDMALEYSELSPRELAVRFTDEKGYFISEASVYRLPSDVTEKMKALERENRELRQANEILRKASAYFAMAKLDRPLKR